MTDDNPTLCNPNCVNGKEDIINTFLVFQEIFDFAVYDIIDIVADDALFLVDWVLIARKDACTVCKEYNFLTIA